MTTNLSILANPPQPPADKRCLYCDKRFALQLVRTEKHRIVGDVRVFACQACGRESQFASQLAAHVV